MDLQGRLAVVTGASRGLGVPLVHALAGRGAHVVLVARDAAGLEEVAAAVRARGGQATCVPCDLADPAALAALPARLEAVGPPHVVVHNAGVEIPVAVVDQRQRDIDLTVAVNLTAPMQLTRALLPGMITRRAGVIVMISSMSGKSPTPYNAIYCATKYGLVGFTASLDIELQGTGVHAGVVCPGFVADTGMWASTGLRAPSSMREVSPDDVVAAMWRVIGGAGEVLVTQLPVRPLLAMSEIAPPLRGAVLSWMGVTEALRDRAVVTARERG